MTSFHHRTIFSFSTFKRPTHLQGSSNDFKKLIFTIIYTTFEKESERGNGEKVIFQETHLINA